MSAKTFNEVLKEAIKDIASRGFNSISRINKWELEIKRAAQKELLPEKQVLDGMITLLNGIYRKQVVQGSLFSRHIGLTKLGVDRIKPKLRRELDRRIIMSANLIKLNRQEAIDKTLKRFNGWVSSIPTGGSDVVDIPNEAKVIKASLDDKFIARRVVIDQTAKLQSSIDAIVAQDAGAIAAIWHSPWRQGGDYRHTHKDRDGKLYLIRDSKGIKNGTIEPGSYPYTDSITQPAEEVYCRCYYQYIYFVRRLPDDALTEKGLKAKNE